VLAYNVPPKLDGETTLTERLRNLRDDYCIIATPLVLLIGIGLNGSTLLAWIAGVLLVALTINVLLMHNR